MHIRKRNDRTAQRIAPVVIIPLSLYDSINAAVRFFGVANEESRSFIRKAVGALGPKLAIASS